MWLATIVQVTVPLLLISVIAFTRQPNIPRWVITILSHGMIILYLLISSRWDLSSLYLRVV
ncbi:MAG: hypothetical protein KJO72_11580, partial [Gammaproteobacteria bacterium]|nr:hypothetical protein [Gammaproteobacteria bacterium]